MWSWNSVSRSIHKRLTWETFNILNVLHKLQLNNHNWIILNKGISACLVISFEIPLNIEQSLFMLYISRNIYAFQYIYIYIYIYRLHMHHCTQNLGHMFIVYTVGLCNNPGMKFKMQTRDGYKKISTPNFIKITGRPNYSIWLTNIE